MQDGQFQIDDPKPKFDPNKPYKSKQLNGNKPSFDPQQPFLVKKKEEDGGNGLENGTENIANPTSGSESSFPLLFPRDKQQPLSANLKPEHQPAVLAQKALVEKNLSPQDISALQQTDYGLQLGLDKLQTDEQKNVYSNLYNQPDKKDVQDSMSEVLNRYPINYDTPEGKKLQDAFNAGNLKEIAAYKDIVMDNIKKQMPTQQGAGGVRGVYGELKPFTDEDIQKRKELESEIAKVNQTFSDFVDNANTEKVLQPRMEQDGKLLDTELKILGSQKEKDKLGNNSFQQRQLLSSYQNKQYLKALKDIQDSDAPEWVKKQALDTYNENHFATENVDYEREKTGLGMVINNLSMKYNDLAKKTMTTNPELKDDASKAYDELKYYQDQYQSIDNRPEYSDIRVGKIARFIGDEYAKKYGAMTPISGKKIQELSAEYDKENPGFLDKYGDDLTFIEQHPQMVPKGGGFVGSAIGGFKAGFYGLGKNLATGFGFLGDDTQKATRDVADQYKTNIQGTSPTGESQTRIVFDNKDKAFREIPNEDYGKFNWNSAGRFLGKSVPGLAEFILLDKGLGKAAQVVNNLGVKGLIRLSEESAKLNGIDITAEEIAAAKNALSIGENTKNSLGLFGALTVTGHEQNRKIADDLIDDNSSSGEAKKTILANLLNLSSFAAFKMAGITPTAALEKALQKSVSKDALKMFEESGWKLTEDQAESFFKDNVLSKLKSIGKSVGGNIMQGAKLGEAMTIDANTRGLLGNIVNPDKNKMPSLRDDAEIFGNQVLLMTAVGLPGLVRNGFSATNKDVLYDAGLQVPENITRINKMLEDGDINQQKANEMISMVKTMGEEVSKVQHLTNDNGLPLTVKQKRDIATEGFRKRAAEKLSENDETIKADGADKNIKETLSDNRFDPADDDPLAQVIGGKNPEDIEPIELTEQETKAIDAIKSKDLSGTGIEAQWKVIQDESSPAEQKKLALREISDQLLSPATAEKVGEILGKDASNAIDELGHETPKETTSLKDINAPEKSNVAIIQPEENKVADIVPLKKTAEEAVSQPEEEIPTTSIMNKVTKEEREQRGMKEVEVEARRSFGDVYEKGKDMVDKGEIDPRILAKELAKKPRALSPEESASLVYDRMRISNEHRRIMSDIEKAREEGNEVKEEVLRSELERSEMDMAVNDEAARKTGYEQGLGLAVRQMLVKQDYSLASQVQRFKNANGGKELPEEVRQKLEDLVKSLEETNKKLDEYDARLQKVESEKDIKKASKEKKGNKTPEQFKAEREKLKQNISDKWKKSSGDTTVTAIPYLKQLIEISPDVAKLVKSYAEEGIINLKEIVDKIHEQIKGAIPDIEKKDVYDLITGKYDPQKEKKTQVYDKERAKIEANVKYVKSQIDLEKQRVELSQKPKVQRALDYIHGWHRFSILSGIPTLGKIGTAALGRGITTRAEGLIGKGLSYIPGISKIAKGAPREGGFSLKAEAEAFTQWVDKMTREDIGMVMKTGQGQLDYLYGERPEYISKTNTWMDFFGRLHAAIKTLPKRAEFFRSLELRSQHALKEGKNLANPIVQQEVTTGAYNDAIRTIFMQDNYVTNAYKSTIRSLQNAKQPGAKEAAHILQFLFPIIKVPTNYVAEQTSYMVGGLKAAYALRHGISKMTPDQKDWVYRAMKKQTLGIAFMAIGFLNPNIFGGYYSGKRDDDDLQSGDIKLFGVKIPHWMAHTPLVEMLQVGATMRRARDEAGEKGEDNGAMTGINRIWRGQMQQVPFFNQSTQISDASSSQKGFKNYIFRLGQSITEPILMKNIAEWTDTEDGETVKRSPQDFLEQLKMGVPGARQQVDKKE